MMPMMSQSFSTSLMMCVEKMTVLPCWRHSRMKLTMVRAVMMSRPSVGSSKIITGGSGTKVRAKETFCFIAVESFSQRRGASTLASSGAEQAVDLAGLAAEADVFDSANHAALLVLKLLRKIARLDHGDSSGKAGHTAANLIVLRGGR